MGGWGPAEATVVRVDPDHDVAVLRCDIGLAVSVAGWAATDRAGLDSAVVVTGVVAVDDPGHTYRFLDASGRWAGGTTRDEQIP